MARGDVGRDVLGKLAPDRGVRERWEAEAVSGEVLGLAGWVARQGVTRKLLLNRSLWLRMHFDNEICVCCWTFGESGR